MKKILVPIDYSYDALDGLDYAMELAKIYGSKLVLFHVYSLSTGFSKALPSKSNEKRGESALKLLQNLAQEYLDAEKNELHYELKVNGGNVIEAILNEAENNDYDIVIMGTRDKHSFLDKWLGTVSMGVGQRCAIPVLLIPHGCKFESIERILVASDYHIDRKGILDFLVEWNSRFKAFIKFLHVKTNPEDKFRKESVEIIKRYYHQEQVNFSFEIELKEGIDIPAIIYQTAVQENMDLIVLTAEKKSNLQAMLLKSVSNEVIIRSLKPILLLHSNSKNP